MPELSGPNQLAALPVVLLAGYALLRFVGTLLNELRDLWPETPSGAAG